MLWKDKSWPLLQLGSSALEEWWSLSCFLFFVFVFWKKERRHFILFHNISANITAATDWQRERLNNPQAKSPHSIFFIVKRADNCVGRSCLCLPSLMLWQNTTCNSYSWRMRVLRRWTVSAEKRFSDSWNVSSLFFAGGSFSLYSDARSQTNENGFF